MLRALGLAAFRVLGARYGIALLLAVLVLGIVGVAQLLGPDEDVRDGLRPGSDPGVTVNPTAGDDGEGTHPPTAEPVTSSGATAAQRLAESFVAAWIDHRNVDSAAWLARLRPYITPSLATELTGVDPAGVPADRVTGATRLNPRGESFVEVTVPVDSGLLRLHVVATDGRWLVDSVDWERR